MRQSEIIKRAFSYKGNEFTIAIVEGDITKIDADAIMTTIKSFPDQWFSGIDNAIKGVGGELFYDYLKEELPLREHQVVFVRGSRHAHPGRLFDSVVFVVDDGALDNAIVMEKALDRADLYGLTRVLAPLFGISFIKQTDEERLIAIAEETFMGILTHFAKKPSTVKEITFVFNNAKEKMMIVKKVLEKLRIV